MNSRLWLVIWVALIVVVVVPWSSFETIPRWDRMEWIPFVSPPVDFLDVVGNVLFYAPYGFLCGVQAASTSKACRLGRGLRGHTVNFHRAHSNFQQQPLSIHDRCCLQRHRSVCWRVLGDIPETKRLIAETKPCHQCVAAVLGRAA